MSLYEEHFEALVAIGRGFGIGRRDAETLAHAVLLSSIRRLDDAEDPAEWLRAAMRYASSGYVAYRKTVQRQERV